MDLKNKIRSLQETLNVEYKKPDPKRLEEMELAVRGSPAWDYLTKERGFNEETIANFRLGYDSKKNAVAIPHFKNGELINIKYRFLNPKDTRYTSEAGAEPWVYNDEGLVVGKEKGAVAIAEGEFDCMALWQMGFKNVISPGSGANSYGIWIEVVDTIKQVWIAYDNDEPGQTAAKELAHRVGVEKCRNVLYPTGVKDANEFMLKHTPSDLRGLFAKSSLFIKNEFSSLPDIIQDMIANPRPYFQTYLFPEVKIYPDNLTVLSGVTNAGKTDVALNVSLDLARQGVPVLILPMERGVYNVGRRLIQIAIGRTEDEIETLTKEEVEAATRDIASLPIFFSMPGREKLGETIARAKRVYNIQYVVIDMINQLVRNVGNEASAISDTMRDLKKLTESLPIAMCVVAHIRKLGPGEKISMDSLKGSNSLSTDPETVVLLDRNEVDKYLEVNVAKNKGKMRVKRFVPNPETGRITDTYDDF
jgi:twinkle protein